MRRLLVLLAALVVGCDSDPASDRAAFDVTLRDDGGGMVATGRLHLDEPLSPGSTVFGTYQLDNDDLTPNARGRLRAACIGGPATDQGRLSIAIDLDVADAGLLLEGGCVSGVQGGVWSRITIAGPTPGGTFEIE